VRNQNAEKLEFEKLRDEKKKQTPVHIAILILIIPNLGSFSICLSCS